MRRFHLVVAPALLLALIASAAPGFAKTPLPAQCPDGRFLVQGNPLIAGSSTPTIEAVLLGASSAITTGCPAAAAKVKRTRKGTTLVVAWPSCPGLSGKVKLKALVAAPACDVMTGALIASKAKPKKRKFDAKRSICGDSVIDTDGGEQCDGAGTCPTGGDTCTSACTCESPTTTSTTLAGGSTTTTSTTPGATTTVTTAPTTTTPTTSTPTTSVPGTTSTSTTLPAAPAVLELNEIAPNVAGSYDLVELRAVSGGTCAGIALEQAGFGTPIALAALPDVVVATDDLIVVHLNAPATGGSGANETTSKVELPAATFPANYDGAWDFAGSPSAIVFGTRVLQVRAAAGALTDATPFVKLPYAPPSGFLAALQNIQTLGLWLPADCGGVACGDATTPAAKDISVDWSAASGTTPTSDTVARHLGASTHQASDWSVAPSTMGAPNAP